MKMVRKKSKRVVKSKVVVRNSKLKNKPARTKTSYAFWFFINALLIAVFIYGGYRVWKYSWMEGLSIIAFDLLVILIIKLILKLRQK
jgi:hypothetical protein